MGRKVRGSLDSETLPPRQARRLDLLLRKSRFFELPMRMAPDFPEPDRFLYRLTVESEQGTHTIEISEAALTDDLRPLLDFLSRSLLMK